jgi:HAD superfamily hydrolase (TIGR01509 family)
VDEVALVNAIRKTIEMVIFDCDGVLVDSEVLSAAVLIEMMAEIGLPLTIEIFQTDFLGRSFTNAAQRAEARFGKPMPPDFQERYRARLLQRIERELQPMPDVFAVLDALAVPYCLATSSSPQRLATSLSSTGLVRYFEHRCFTASQVSSGKPAPDLFLFAAASMEVVPDRCLAIEDSEMGVRSALNAAMQVWHFAGGGHIRAGYRLPQSVVPDRAIADMRELHDALSALGLCLPD